MSELRLSEQARIYLEDIRSSGIEQFGQAAAQRHLQAIRQSLILLSEHPFAGQDRPELARDIRTISRRPHRILYTVRGDLVLIVRVIHQARDLPSALRGDS